MDAYSLPIWETTLGAVPSPWGQKNVQSEKTVSLGDIQMVFQILEQEAAKRDYPDQPLHLWQQRSEEEKRKPQALQLSSGRPELEPVPASTVS